MTFCEFILFIYDAGGLSDCHLLPVQSGIMRQGGLVG